MRYNTNGFYLEMINNYIETTNGLYLHKGKTQNV